MKRSDLERIIEDLEVSPEVRKRIDEVLSAESDEISVEAAKQIDALLELEADLMDIKAGIYNDLSGSASQLNGEMEKIEMPNFNEFVEKTEKLVKGWLDDFKSHVFSQLDSLEKGTN